MLLRWHPGKCCAGAATLALSSRLARDGGVGGDPPPATLGEPSPSGRKVRPQHIAEMKRGLVIATGLLLLGRFPVSGADAQQNRTSFSFSLGGVPSAQVLAAMQKSSHSSTVGARTDTVDVYTRADGFNVTVTRSRYNLSSLGDGSLASASAFGDEWLVEFGNSGVGASPLLCDVAPLNYTIPLPSLAAEVRRFAGSAAQSSDYLPITTTLKPKGAQPSLENETRLWGDVISRSAIDSPLACVRSCVADTACVGMVLSIVPSNRGCYLLGSVRSQDAEAGYTSWLKDNGGSVSFEPNGGRSSNGELPYFNVFAPDDPDGIGSVISIGWSGNWRAAVSVENQSTPHARLLITHRSSDSPSGLCTHLQPSESLRSMRILHLRYPSGGPSGFHLGFNLHRQLLMQYKAPRLADGSLAGALVSSWSWLNWPQYPKLTLESQLWHVDAVKNSTSVEAYWLDAGWFTDGFPSGVGNWQLPIAETVYPEEFPNKTLAPLAERAHARPNPVQFIVWFEPERAANGTYLFDKHPEVRTVDSLVRGVFSRAGCFPSWRGSRRLRFPGCCLCSSHRGGP